MPIPFDSISLFKDLAPGDGAALKAMANEVIVEENEALVEESSTGDSVFAIISGRVTIHLNLPDGSESVSIAVLRSGDILGESIILGRTRRIASAVAKDKVVALEWSANGLLDYFQKNPAAGYVVMRNLARIVHDRLTATNMMLRNTINGIVDVMR